MGKYEKFLSRYYMGDCDDLTETNNVFVYGTLRKAYGNHRLIAGNDGVFLGNAKTKNNYSMWVSGIPYVTKKARNSIVGEVYQMSKEAMFDLDMLEGHPIWYKRELIPVVLEDGTETEAWLYFCDHTDAECRRKGLSLVTNGDYSSHRSGFGFAVYK